MPDVAVNVGTPSLPIVKRPILFKRGWCGGAAKSTEHAVYQLSILEGLSPQQSEAIAARYINLVETTRLRARVYAYTYHIGRTIVTVGSLIVPALLSIQYTSTGPSGLDSKSLSYVIYWITWFVSLLVTTCNGVLTLLKVDKKYHLLHTTLEQYKTEVWQYIHLSGKYGKIIENQAPTHANQYIFFTYNLEKIRMKMVQEEYFKLMDGKEQSKDAAAAATANGGATGPGGAATLGGSSQPEPSPSQRRGTIPGDSDYMSSPQMRQVTTELFNTSTPDPVLQRLSPQQQRDQRQQRQQQIRQQQQRGPINVQT